MGIKQERYIRKNALINIINSPILDFFYNKLNLII